MVTADTVVVTESHATDTTETNTVASGETIFTDTVETHSLFNTETDSAATVSPPANDAGGSSSDTVAAPVAATAPEVSTTVDASPSAAIDASPSTTVDASPSATVDASQPEPHEAAIVAVGSAVDVQVAPVAEVPAPTDVIAAAAVVAPPAAVCITANDCVTVIQAMLTAVAKMVSAPLTTVSSWFGNIWYQADAAVAPPLPSRWTAPGDASASQLASMLMPASLATLLRHSTVDGVASSTKVGGTVFDQINILDQTTAADTASSQAVSSRPVMTAAAAAPRELTKFVLHALDKLATSPSLAMLTLAVLPGLGGIIIITAAGMRIGYRQAKFGFAMRSSGLARYGRPGPLGVVRTGSFIAVRPRTRSPRPLQKAA